VRKVLSKDIALAQCRGWLSRHLPHAVLVETESTAAAVEVVAREPQGQVAVASATAAESRGVPILARGIQDRRDNATRFFVYRPYRQRGRRGRRGDQRRADLEA